MNEEDDLDLSAWDADEPPPGFADRVVRKALSEGQGEATATPRAEGSAGSAGAGVEPAKAPRPLARRRTFAAVVTSLALAAGALFWVTSRPPASGEISADTERTEVRIGDRAVAVLEPGARLSFRGGTVDQTKGNVFYRVEPGGGFRVHTAAGDVDVTGTCFRVDVKASGRSDEMQARDVKMGALGAALALGMSVAVYEGKVAVSHAQERVTLKAGESADVSDADGVVVTSAKLGAAGAAGSQDAPLEEANKSLVVTVSDMKKRLETIESQKKDLEQKLSQAEEKLKAEQKGADGAPAKNDFDLSQDDLVALAKEGTLKYRVPCSKQAGYKPDADVVNKLGLAPQDADTIANAYKKVAEWREKNMRPICQEVLGRSELTDKMSVDSCMHLVSDFLSETDPKARTEAQQLAVDIRAGLKTPPAGEKMPPLTRMMLASTQQIKVFEEELAKSFGPDEAHRITYADGLCMGHSTWGGGKKK
jgi:ferric-dicitrate binding protein FerR (iron transport regulator)